MKIIKDVIKNGGSRKVEILNLSVMTARKVLCSNFICLILPITGVLMEYQTKRAGQKFYLEDWHSATTLSSRYPIECTAKLKTATESTVVQTQTSLGARKEQKIAPIDLIRRPSVEQKTFWLLHMHETETQIRFKNKRSKFRKCQSLGPDLCMQMSLSYQKIKYPIKVCHIAQAIIKTDPQPQTRFIGGA